MDKSKRNNIKRTIRSHIPVTCRLNESNRDEKLAKKKYRTISYVILEASHIMRKRDIVHFKFQLSCEAPSMYNSFGFNWLLSHSAIHISMKMLTATNKLFIVIRLFF